MQEKLENDCYIYFDIKYTQSIFSHSKKAVVTKRRNNILYCKLIQNETPPAGLTFALLYHLILTVEKWFKWVNWWTVLRDFRHGLGSSQAPKLPQFFVPWRQYKMRFEQRTLVLSLVSFIYSFWVIFLTKYSGIYVVLNWLYVVDLT